MRQRRKQAPPYAFDNFGNDTNCPLWLTGRDKADRTAEAATFELLDRAAHELFLRLGLESVS